MKAKRDEYWNPVSGRICSSHFSPDCYEGLGIKLAGFSSRPSLKKTAVPTIHANPTPEQISEARRLKRKLPSVSTPVETGQSVEQYITPKRKSRALSKLVAHRVSTILTKFKHGAYSRLELQYIF